MDDTREARLTLLGDRTVAADRSPTMPRTDPEMLDGLHRYVEQCRSRVVAGLAATREGALVADYFERGKMIRGLLVFAAASAVGGDPARAMFAAEAIELLHGASLFHDDLIDGADERRGLPALHHRVRAGGAVVLGDLLIMQAFSVLSEAQAASRADRVLDAVWVLGTQAQACCRGQLLELELTGQSTSENAYFDIVEGKTAAPFVAAAAVGAILGGGDSRDREALAAYGLHLGIAFQICDDMLDLLGEDVALGKPVGNSLSCGRPLLALIYLQNHGSRSAQEQWKVLQQQGAAHRELMPLLRQEGIDRRVRAVQEQHVAAALSSLVGLPDTAGLRTLRELPASAATW